MRYELDAPLPRPDAKTGGTAHGPHAMPLPGRRVVLMRSALSVLLGIFLGYYAVYRLDLGAYRLMTLALGYGEDPPWLCRSFSRDPRIGSQLLLRGVRPGMGDTDVHVPGSLTAILYAYSCNSCGSDGQLQLASALIETHPTLSVCIVMPGPPEIDVQSLLRRSNRLQFVRDPDGGIARRLNAVLTYRWYLLDEKSVLLFASGRNWTTARISLAIAQVVSDRRRSRGYVRSTSGPGMVDAHTAGQLNG